MRLVSQLSKATKFEILSLFRLVSTSARIECLNSIIVITEDNMLHILNAKSDNIGEVKLTGAGGQGFVPKCTTLKIQKSIQINQIGNVV